MYCALYLHARGVCPNPPLQVTVLFRVTCVGVWWGWGLPELRGSLLEAHCEPGAVEEKHQSPARKRKILSLASAGPTPVFTDAHG
jgi:hypothetical protein